MDRILEMGVRPEAVRPRPGFNRQEYWDAARKRFEGEMPSPTVTMGVSPAARRALPEATVVREEPEGGAVVQISVPHRGAAVAYALSHAADVTVLDPPDIRDSVIAAARQLPRRRAFRRRRCLNHTRLPSSPGNGSTAAGATNPCAAISCAACSGATGGIRIRMPA
ncbi:MAG: WYL domain-containing protein [Chloroflexi bacterium]|nr:WYL domain-containing protein [Chloroflexota bacterium]